MVHIPTVFQKTVKTVKNREKTVYKRLRNGAKTADRSRYEKSISKDHHSRPARECAPLRKIVSLMKLARFLCWRRQSELDVRLLTWAESDDLSVPPLRYQ